MGSISRLPKSELAYKLLEQVECNASDVMMPFEAKPENV